MAAGCGARSPTGCRGSLLRAGTDFAYFPAINSPHRSNPRLLPSNKKQIAQSEDENVGEAFDFDDDGYDSEDDKKQKAFVAWLDAIEAKAKEILGNDFVHLYAGITGSVLTRDFQVSPDLTDSQIESYKTEIQKLPTEITSGNEDFKNTNIAFVVERSFSRDPEKFGMALSVKRGIKWHWNFLDDSELRRDFITLTTMF